MPRLFGEISRRDRRDGPQLGREAGQRLKTVRPLGGDVRLFWGEASSRSRRAARYSGVKAVTDWTGLWLIRISSLDNAVVTSRPEIAAPRDGWTWRFLAQEGHSCQPGSGPAPLR